jgi:hypothetical protein
MLHGARICPQCRTRVDERRARTSPYCLSCGAALGTAGTTGFGKKAGGGSALPWILGGIGAVLLLGFVGVIVMIVAVAESPPDLPPVAAFDGAATPLPTNLEPPPSATVPAKAPTAPKTAAPRPTPTPVSTPAPTPTFAFPTPTPPSTPTNPPTLGAFPRARATNELERVTASLASCKTASGPTGSGSIRVDFEPDGRVGTLLRKPFAGTTTGSCVSSRFLAIKIGKFDGTTQQVERTFTID